MYRQAFAVLFSINLLTILLSISSESSFAKIDYQAIAPKPPVEANNAASLGKNIVAKLVTTDSKEATGLGFHSSGEATETNMTVGTGMAIMSLNIESVKVGDAPLPIAKILKPTGEFLYPILVKCEVQCEVRSAITVRKIGKTGDWRPVAYGARGALLAAEKLKQLESAFIVRFYAKNLWFLAAGKADDLVFHPLRPNPMSVIGVDIGPAEIFKEVFAELIEEGSGLKQHSHLHR